MKWIWIVVSLCFIVRGFWILGVNLVDSWSNGNEIVELEWFLWQVFLCFIGVPFGLRLVTEILIVIFKINESLQELKKRGRV